MSFAKFVLSQWASQPAVVKVDLAGKTVIVLGANTGLGFEAVKHFATMNPARLILACRNESKGNAALQRLRSETKYTKAELWLVDLADFASVKAFADKFERDGGRLDILVANAGIAVGKYEATVDGWESSLQVNDLSTPLVALRLLPTMIKTAVQHSTVARLVIVSSSVHEHVEIEESVYNKPHIFKTLGSSAYCTPKTMGSRYPLTKLLNVFFTRALNAHIPSSTPVIVNTVNPGFCRSELSRNTTGMQTVAFFVMKAVLALPTEVGSRRLVWGAVAHADEPDTLRGQYISASAVDTPSDFVRSPQGIKAQDNLWSVAPPPPPVITGNY
ncbi:hypothetical protein C8R46DRAFT_914484 [Mycena filopes]|nr:hypothetical protein C8R46DRAFT_914484 [Mycena filopes]